MSRLTDFVCNTAYCNTKEMIDFVKVIDKKFSHFPPSMRRDIEDELVSVFEKGLVLGLNHFDDHNSEE